MGHMVIVAYRPKLGRQSALEALVRRHAPFLRELGFVTDRPAQAMLAKDGTIVEVFEWRDGAIEEAHANPKVHELWAEFAAACDYVPLRDLAEAADLFAGFKPMEL